MLSKKTYDIISIIFIAIILSLFFFSSFITQKIVANSMLEDGETFSDIPPEVRAEKIAELENSFFFKYKVMKVVQWAVGLIYWIFILMLAIHMYSIRKISMLDVIIIAIAIPLAIVFYFLTLRKHFKEISVNENYSLQ